MATTPIPPPVLQRSALKTWRTAAACWWVLCSCAVGAGVGDEAGVAHSQKVYRCGNRYSHEARCDQGLAQTVTGLTNPNPDSAQTLTKAMQDEATRLEKIRQRETSAQKQQQVTPRRSAAVVMSKEKSASDASSDTGLKNQHQKRHAASPYFTAKESAATTKP